MPSLTTQFSSQFASPASLAQHLVRSVASLATVQVLPTPAPDPAGVLRSLVAGSSSATAGPAVYCVDVGVVAQKYLDFVAALPRVTPFYAVKCNPDPIVIRVLSILGANFDCASVDELQLVAEAGEIEEAALDARVVYANPCKQKSHLQYAARLGVRLMTFDCEDELEKIAHVHPTARLLLRIAVEDSASLCPLSSKYGAEMANVGGLLGTANRLRLQVVGVAFHVGSGCRDVGAYVDALHRARLVFDEALRMGLPALSIVDIGGGFPGFDAGDEGVSFSSIASAVRVTLDQLFEESIRVIAEPGRYFVAAAYSLATQVLARRKSVGPQESGAIVIGDGVYGSFKDALLLNLSFQPKELLSVRSDDAIGVGEGETVRDGEAERRLGEEEPGAALVPTTLYGPTCDARDVVGRSIPLSGAVSSGDWLYFCNMGAYTISLATSFNSMPRPQLHYYIGSFN